MTDPKSFHIDNDTPKLMKQLKKKSDLSRITALKAKFRIPLQLPLIRKLINATAKLEKRERPPHTIQQTFFKAKQKPKTTRHN